MDLLAQMAMFVRVVEGQSLSSAARAQGLSLPAISRQLRALEADLGASLIVRSTRKLHVTDAGQEWYASCVRILRDIEDARLGVRSSKLVRGRLVVSAPLTFGMAVIVPRLKKLVAVHPQLAIALRLEDHLVDLVGEGVDVAIRAGSPPPDSTAFIAQPVFAMRRVLVASRSWLRKNGTPREPRDVAASGCLMQVTLAGSPVRWLLQRESDEAVTETVDVRSRLSTNAPSALRELALGGAGIAYVPDWLVADDLASHRLRRVLPDWSSPSITAWAVYRAELRGAPRLRAFLDALPTSA